MEQKEKISIHLYLFNALLLVGIIYFVFAIHRSTPTPKPLTAHVQEAVIASTHAFDTVSLQAKAVYVYDIVNNKVLYEKNEETQLPLASLTKLMTALTAIQSVPKDLHITIKKEFLQEEGDSGLVANESWSLKNLLDFSLVVSSNDGARSVASVIGATMSSTTDYTVGRKDFIQKMNDEAKVLGLTQTYFINESGLDEGTISGGYGSAENIAKLMQYMLTTYPDILEVTKYQATTIDSFSKQHKAVNTDTIINKIPNLIASKTGYTDMAGGNLAVTFDASIGRPIVIVVLGSTSEGRFVDVDNLVQASLNFVRQ